MHFPCNSVSEDWFQNLVAINIFSSTPAIQGSYALHIKQSIFTVFVALGKAMCIYKKSHKWIRILKVPHLLCWEPKVSESHLEGYLTSAILL